MKRNESKRNETKRTFVICTTENLLRKLISTKSAIRILTNTDHSIRPYFRSPNKLDEYAMRPRNPQPLFIRTAEYMCETQIDIRRIETLSRYDRPPWKPVDEKQYDVSLSGFGPGTTNVIGLKDQNT
jgi:hypothetical protein